MRTIIQSGGEAIQEGGARVLAEPLRAPLRAFEEWQRRVDERVRTLVDSVSPFAALQKELAQLSARVADLERRIGTSKD